MRLRILIQTRGRLFRLFALGALFSLVSLVPTAGWSNSGGGEHGGGGAEKPAEAAKEEKNAPKTCRFSDHESRLTAFTARIRSFEKEISDMIEAKKKVDQAEAVRQLTQQITFKHLDLGRAIKEYESERLHMRFEHPDRDVEGNREYPRQALKSLKDLEQAFGLDGRLDRIKNQVGVVFPSRTPGETSPEHGMRGIASEAADDEDRPPDRIRLSK